MPEANKRRHVSFPCKGCGSLAEYDPDEKSLSCPHCGTADPIPATDEEIEEFAYRDLLKTAAAQGFSGHGREFKCRRCAASFFLATEVISGDCPYCDSPVVVTEAEISRSHVIPEAVLPFAIEEETARERYRQWIGSLWFAPGKLKKQSTLEKLRGVYRPYWTFDSFTSNAYSGYRGEYYYRTVGSGKNRRTVREVRWHHESGRFTRFFDDVLVNAGQGLDFDTRFRLAELKPYEPRYLSGWRAETYSMEPAEGWAKAKQIIHKALLEEAERRVGGDTQRDVRVSTAHSQVTCKHVLLPLFVGAFEYRRKFYRFQVNGQTGDVKGKRPWSVWKILFAVLGGLALLAGVIIIYLLSQNPGG